MKKITKTTFVIYLSVGTLMLGLFKYVSAPSESKAVFANTSPLKTNQIITAQATDYQQKSLKPILKEDLSENIIASTPIKLMSPFAASLEGTDIDGQLQSNALGNLIIDLEVRDFFDYFLNTVGDVSAEAALAEIKKIAESSLPPSAAKQALQILDEYLLYKETAMTLMSQPMIPKEQQTKQYQIEMLESAFEQIKTIRRQTMSPETVTAFFELEEAYGEYTLASIKIQNDETLSVDEKIALTAFHREKLPKVIQDTEDSVIANAAKHKEVHHAILSSSQDKLKQTLADHHYTEAETNEILAYQDAQKDFDQRYQQYLRDKQTLKQSGLSAQDQSQQLETIQAHYFTNESELSQARVRDLRS